LKTCSVGPGGLERLLVHIGVSALATVTGRADNKPGLWQLATSGQLPGLLVFDADLAVGWCELAPRA
jgi:hypothetical protein